MILTDHEKELAAAALKHAADDLISGMEAAIRLGHRVDTETIAKVAQEMRQLKAKLELRTG